MDISDVDVVLKLIISYLQLLEFDDEINLDLRKKLLEVLEDFVNEDEEF